MRLTFRCLLKTIHTVRVKPIVTAANTKYRHHGGLACRASTFIPNSPYAHLGSGILTQESGRLFTVTNVSGKNMNCSVSVCNTCVNYATLTVIQVSLFIERLSVVDFWASRIDVKLNSWYTVRTYLDSVATILAREAGIEDVQRPRLTSCMRIAVLSSSLSSLLSILRFRHSTALSKL